MKTSPLMMVATVCSFGLLVLLIFFPLPDKNAQTFLALASFVMGFYFGSSINKQPQQAAQIPTAPDIPPEVTAFAAAAVNAANTIKSTQQ